MSFIIIFTYIFRCTALVQLIITTARLSSPLCNFRTIIYLGAAFRGCLTSPRWPLTISPSRFLHLLRGVSACDAHKELSLLSAALLIRFATRNARSSSCKWLYAVRGTAVPHLYRALPFDCERLLSLWQCPNSFSRLSQAIRLVLLIAVASYLNGLPRIESSCAMCKDPVREVDLSTIAFKIVSVEVVHLLCTNVPNDCDLNNILLRNNRSRNIVRIFRHEFNNETVFSSNKAFFFF